MDSHVTSVVAFPWLPVPWPADPCALITDRPDTTFFGHDDEACGLVPRCDGTSHGVMSTLGPSTSSSKGRLVDGPSAGAPSAEEPGTGRSTATERQPCAGTRPAAASHPLGSMQLTARLHAVCLRYRRVRYSHRPRRAAGQATLRNACLEGPSHERRPTLRRQRHLHHRRQRSPLVRPALGRAAHVPPAVEAGCAQSRVCTGCRLDPA